MSKIKCLQKFSKVQSNYCKTILKSHSDNVLKLGEECKKPKKKKEEKFSSHGIIHPQTPPHILEHNVIARRKHRCIKETDLTLLHQASMPLQFWPQAFQIVVYLLNRLPSNLYKI